VYHILGKQYHRQGASSIRRCRYVLSKQLIKIGEARAAWSERMGWSERMEMRFLTEIECAFVLFLVEYRHVCQRTRQCAQLFAGAAGGHAGHSGSRGTEANEGTAAGMKSLPKRKTGRCRAMQVLRHEPVHRYDTNLFTVAT
jgi:hypothetical protein